jgi:hypothetical protein
MAGGVDKALVDEPSTRGAELRRAAVHDGGDITGGVFAAAELGHRAQVLELEFGRAFGADAEERFVELRLDCSPRLLGNAFIPNG